MNIYIQYLFISTCMPVCDEVETSNTASPYIKSNAITSIHQQTNKHKSDQAHKANNMAPRRKHDTVIRQSCEQYMLIANLHSHIVHSVCGPWLLYVALFTSTSCLTNNKANKQSAKPLCSMPIYTFPASIIELLCWPVPVKHCSTSEVLQTLRSQKGKEPSSLQGNSNVSHVANLNQPLTPH